MKRPARSKSRPIRWARPEPEDYAQATLGATDDATFISGMKSNHAFAIEYTVRLLRITIEHHGPFVNSRSIYGQLNRASVKEFRLSRDPGDFPRRRATCTTPDAFWEAHQNKPRPTFKVWVALRPVHPRLAASSRTVAADLGIPGPGSDRSGLLTGEYVVVDRHSARGNS